MDPDDAWHNNRPWPNSASYYVVGPAVVTHLSPVPSLVRSTGVTNRSCSTCTPFTPFGCMNGAVHASLPIGLAGYLTFPTVRFALCKFAEPPV